MEETLLCKVHVYSLVQFNCLGFPSRYFYPLQDHSAWRRLYFVRYTRIPLFISTVWGFYFSPPFLSLPPPLHFVYIYLFILFYLFIFSSLFIYLFFIFVYICIFIYIYICVCVCIIFIYIYIKLSNNSTWPSRHYSFGCFKAISNSGRSAISKRLYFDSSWYRRNINFEVYIWSTVIAA